MDMKHKVEGVYAFDLKTELDTTVLAQYITSVSTEFISEVPLSEVKSWGSSCRFQDQVVDGLRDGNRYCFKCFFLAPVRVNKNLQHSTEKKIEWVQEKLISFYSSIFHRNSNDIDKIVLAVKHEWSVIVFGVKQRGTSGRSCTSAFRHTGAFIIGAVTFMPFDNLAEREVSSFISWLAVSEDGGGQGWRHLGFGRFLLIHVIKRCMCHLEIQNQASPGAEPFESGHVRLFLQSTNAQALMFYTSNGFIVLSDDKDNDGYDKLPKCIRAELPRLGDETSFIGFDPEDELPASKLLFLPPNNLRKTNDHILDLSDDIENIIPPSQDDPTSVSAVLDLTSSPAKVNPRESQANLQLSSWWCEYPFRSKGDLRNLSYRSSDFLSLMKNLHVLRHLLPTDPILPLCQVKVCVFMDCV